MKNIINKENMNDLECMLARKYEQKYAYFTGNGTTALYLIFKALNIQNKEVIFPNITCMAPVNSAIYAGYNVKFCDVNSNDFTINIDSLKRQIEKGNVGIVVATHIYGNMCDMKSIYELCKSKAVMVIEDAAQTVEVTKYNDYAITSFGHTKLFETSKGGGVIFYNNSSYKEYFDYYSRNLKNESNSEEFKIYTDKYYNIIKNFTEQQCFKKIKELQINSKEMFLRHFKENKELYEVIKNKDNIVKGRLERERLYKDNLLKENFIFYRNRIKDNPLWRLTLLVENIERNLFVELVRKNNIDISTWYPCLHNFYNNQSDEELKNSIYVSENLVNFWVTEKYEIDKIINDISKINDIVRGMTINE
ncbi:aminotransferase DegT [Clostridium botulinum]|nr:aminotransferase DegT [Clostridium botulinum]